MDYNSPEVNSLDFSQIWIRIFRFIRANQLQPNILITVVLSRIGKLDCETDTWQHLVSFKPLESTFYMGTYLEFVKFKVGHMRFTIMIQSGLDSQSLLLPLPLIYLYIYIFYNFSFIFSQIHSPIGIWVELYCWVLLNRMESHCHR